MNQPSVFQEPFSQKKPILPGGSRYDRGSWSYFRQSHEEFGGADFSFGLFEFAEDAATNPPPQRSFADRRPGDNCRDAIRGD